MAQIMLRYRNLRKNCISKSVERQGENFFSRMGGINLEINCRIIKIFCQSEANKSRLFWYNFIIWNDVWSGWRKCFSTFKFSITLQSYPTYYNETITLLESALHQLRANIFWSIKLKHLELSTLFSYQWNHPTSTSYWLA